MNESTNERVGISKVKTPTAPGERQVRRYDEPEVTATRLVRRERIALVVGIAIPVFLEVMYHFFLRRSMAQGAVHAVLIAFSALAIPVYALGVNVKNDLKNFLPDFNIKATLIEIARLNELNHERAWVLFDLLSRIGDICAFFAGFMVSAFSVYVVGTYLN